MQSLKNLPLLGIIAGLAVGAAGVTGFAERAPDVSSAAMRGFSEAFADVAAKVKPSVVTVFSEKTVHMPRFQHPFGNGQIPFDWLFNDDDSRPRHSMPHDYKQTGMGSGIVLDKDGHILTNNHVIDDTDQVKVKLSDGVIYDAEVVGTDPRTDIAILKLKGKLPTLVPAAFGDSDAMRVGEWVLAVGAPFGYEQTVTAGIISAKGRTNVDDDENKYQDFLQTDAAINPGNSGGPLLNLQGEVVGINTAIATSVGQFAGVGFAIPINMVNHVMRDLLKGGKISRGFLGIGIQDVTADLAAQFNFHGSQGAIIAQIGTDTPASHGGMRVGDVVVRFNGKDVEDTRQLRNLVAETDPDTKVDVVVSRDGKEHTLKLVVGALPEDDITPARHSHRHQERNEQSADFGLSVEPLSGERAHELGYAKNDEGILVVSVDNGSPAAEAGIRPGDVIIEVNHGAVANVDDFHAALDKSKDKALLLIKNKMGSRFVVVTVK